MIVLPRRLVIKAGMLAATAGPFASKFATASGSEGRPNRAFSPGELWLDTSGKPIQAHGGSVIASGGLFYWYGENKELTDGRHGIESWGIRFYRSRDLYNWEDLGAIIPPDEGDSRSPLSPKGFPERPHILFNPKTKKFVCWLRIRGHGPEYRTVLTADEITGPYTIVQKKLRPAGLIAGDFDLYVDQTSGKAYMYFEQNHVELVCIELSDDWTNVTDRLTRHFPRTAPDTREGIAAFSRQGHTYITSSGMTGYFPNPSIAAISDDPNGSFKELGDLHPSDRSRTSFNSQISCIFKHPGKRDLYIAMADRWLPQIEEESSFASGELSGLVQRGIVKATRPPRQPLSPEEKEVLMKYSAPLTNVNTSISRYVWLPLSFVGDRPFIRWRKRWRVEDFR